MNQLQHLTLTCEEYTINLVSLQRCVPERQEELSGGLCSGVVVWQCAVVHLVCPSCVWWVARLGVVMPRHGRTQ